MSVPCPACGAPAIAPPPAATGRPHSATQEMRKQVLDTLMQVRGADLEPYIGLRYLSKLFRVMAIIIGLLLSANLSAFTSRPASAWLARALATPETVSPPAICAAATSMQCAWAKRLEPARLC